MQIFVAEAKNLGPLNECFGATSISNKAVGSLVASLFFASSPNAVLWTIVLIIILSFDTVLC